MIWIMVINVLFKCVNRFFVNALNILMSFQDIETYLSSENKKEADVVNVRLENIKLKNKLKKKEQQLKSKVRFSTSSSIDTINFYELTLSI